jgi:hypothetical protein
MKPTWCTFHLIYWESRTSTCFEHYLLILRKRYTNDTWYIACVLCQLTATPPEDEQVMLETCRDPWFLINWTRSASRWFHYTGNSRYSDNLNFMRNRTCDMHACSDGMTLRRLVQQSCSIYVFKRQPVRNQAEPPYILTEAFCVFLSYLYKLLRYFHSGHDHINLKPPIQHSLSLPRIHLMLCAGERIVK